MADEDQDQPAPPPMARRVDRQTEPNDESRSSEKRRPLDESTAASRRRTYDRDRVPDRAPSSGWRIFSIMLAIFGLVITIGLIFALVKQNDDLEASRSRVRAFEYENPSRKSRQVDARAATPDPSATLYQSMRSMFDGITAEERTVKDANKWFNKFLEDVKDRKEFSSYNASRMAAEAELIGNNSLPKKLVPADYSLFADAVIAYSQAEWRQWDLEKTKLIRIESDKSSSVVRIIARHTMAKSGRTELVCWYLDQFDNAYQLIDWESLTYGNSGSLLIAYEILKSEKLLPRADEYGNLLGIRSMALQSEDLYPYQVNSTMAEAGRLAPTGNFAILFQHAEVRRLLNESKPRPALEVLDHLLKLQPGNLGLQLLQAEALTRNAEYLNGLALSQKLATLLDNDVELLTTQGLAHIGLARLDDAEKVLTQALDRDPGHYPALSAYKKTTSKGNYEKFLTRFAKYPKPDTILYKLNQDYAKPEDDEFRLAVAREYNRIRPKDAQARRNFITALVTNKRWEELQPLLVQWVKPMNDQERNQLIRDIVIAANTSKEPLTLYKLISPYLDEKSDGFPILARQIAFRADEKPYRYAPKKLDEKEIELARKELGMILEAHAKGHPNDPWLNYFRAKQSWFKKDYTGAEKFLATVTKLPTVYLESEDEDEVSSNYELREFRIRIGVKLGKVGAIYDDMQKKSGNTYLTSIFEELEDQKEGTALLEVAGRHAKAYPNDIETNKYLALGHEFKKDFQQAATSQKKYLNDLDTGETYGRWKADAARKKYIRLLVKAGKAEEAHEYAVEQNMNAIDVVYTLAASSQRDDVINRMTDEIRSGEMKAEQFYADPDLKTILMTTRYEKFREKYPFKEATPEDEE